MKAVTTPFPLPVLNLAFTFPYHIYRDVASTVPTVLGAIVSSSEFLYGTAFPSATQSVLDGSPRYLVFEVIPVMSLNVYVLSWHMGAGTHESRPKEERGSQPPRQYAPLPHSPYSANGQPWPNYPGNNNTHGSNKAGIRGSDCPDRTSSRRAPQR